MKIHIHCLHASETLIYSKAILPTSKVSNARSALTGSILLVRWRTISIAIMDRSKNQHPIFASAILGANLSYLMASPTLPRRLCYSYSISVHFTFSRLRINSSYRFNSDLKLKFLSVCSGSLWLLVQRSQVDDKVLKCNISLEEHVKSQIIPSGLF